MSGSPIKHRIEVEGESRVFECAEDQSLLAALAPIHRKKIRCGCRGGGCGVCKIEILEGECERGCMSEAHVSDADRDHGLVLACKTFPRSSMRVRVVGPALAPVYLPVVPTGLVAK